jgi:hypothetical protein
MATLKDTSIDAQDYIQLPVGTTAQRPTAQQGMMRVCTNFPGESDPVLEWYTGTEWSKLGTIFNPVQATGGTVTTHTVDGREYKVHTFTSAGNNTFTVANVGTEGKVEVLIVAGGGGGGNDNAGGGGAGGLLYYGENTSPKTPNGGLVGIAAQSYTITVGNYGNSAQDNGTDVGGNGGRAGNGGNSVAFGFTASGGGGGGSAPGSPQGAFDGGSGGGGIGNTDGSQRVGQGTSGQGNNGGTGADGGGGGGGGAGGTGQNGDVRGDKLGGTGGPGLQYDIRTGSNVWYAAGGGGGNQNSVSGTTGRRNQIGGSGGNSTSAGITNSGSGGGGGTYPQAHGSRGGSGIVIIRYPNE